MKGFIFLFIILFQVGPLWAQDQEYIEKRNKILKIVEEELEETLKRMMMRVAMIMRYLWKSILKVVKLKRLLHGKVHSQITIFQILWVPLIFLCTQAGQAASIKLFLRPLLWELFL